MNAPRIARIASQKGPDAVVAIPIASIRITWTWRRGRGRWLCCCRSRRAAACPFGLTRILPILNRSTTATWITVVDGQDPSCRLPFEFTTGARSFCARRSRSRLVCCSRIAERFARTRSRPRRAACCICSRSGRRIPSHAGSRSLGSAISSRIGWGNTETTVGHTVVDAISRNKNPSRSAPNIVARPRTRRRVVWLRSCWRRQDARIVDPFARSQRFWWIGADAVNSVAIVRQYPRRSGIQGRIVV